MKKRLEAFFKYWDEKVKKGEVSALKGEVAFWVRDSGTEIEVLKAFCAFVQSADDELHRDRPESELYLAMKCDKCGHK